MMQISRIFSVLLTVGAILLNTASAQTTHSVLVGESGLTFSPSQVTAAEGDIVEFEFHPKNHSLTQSSFATPCAAKAGGVDSGFMPVAANITSFPVYRFQISEVTPLWFFCAQTGHCEEGMVFALNVNTTSPNTFAAFLASATGNSTTAATTGSASVPAASNTAVPTASGMMMSYGASATTTSAPASSSTGTASSGASARAKFMSTAFGLVAVVAWAGLRL